MEFCCTEAWCSNGAKWKVCSNHRPGETEEQCLARVNQKRAQLQGGPLPVTEDCAESSAPEGIWID